MSKTRARTIPKTASKTIRDIALQYEVIFEQSFMQGYNDACRGCFRPPNDGTYGRFFDYVTGVAVHRYGLVDPKKRHAFTLDFFCRGSLDAFEGRRREQGHESYRRGYALVRQKGWYGQGSSPTDMPLSANDIKKSLLRYPSEYPCRKK